MITDHPKGQIVENGFMYTRKMSAVQNHLKNVISFTAYFAVVWSVSRPDNLYWKPAEGVRRTNVSEADNELRRDVGLLELHNEGSEQQISPRNRPNSTQCPERHPDCFFFLLCSSAAARKRVKDVQAQYTRNVPLIFRNSTEQSTLLKMVTMKMLHIYIHRRRIDVWVVCSGSWEETS